MLSGPPDGFPNVERCAVLCASIWGRVQPTVDQSFEQQRSGIGWTAAMCCQNVHPSPGSCSAAAQCAWTISARYSGFLLGFDLCPSPELISWSCSRTFSPRTYFGPLRPKRHSDLTIPLPTILAWTNTFLARCQPFAFHSIFIFLPGCCCTHSMHLLARGFTVILLTIYFPPPKGHWNCGRAHWVGNGACSCGSFSLHSLYCIRAPVGYVCRVHASSPLHPTH